MTTLEHRSAPIAWTLAAVAASALAACAQQVQPGQKVVDCGPEYELRAMQRRLPSTQPGVVVVDITTTDSYDSVPGIQIGLNGPGGRFYVDKLPRSFAYTDSRGQLRVEWHPPQGDAGGAGQPTVLSFDALDFPGECSIDLQVSSER